MWHYDDRGQFEELTHEDEGGILDRYRYEYDLMGNKTAVTKERRGLREESGRYVYGYDALSRLVSVSRDGDALREYAYDAFGNRSSMEDYGRGRNISYTYDALNRLTSTEEDSLDAVLQGNTVHTDYYYDNRGNMIREETEGKLIHGYEYGAMNRLAKAWDDKGHEALYKYNGLGQRTGKTVSGRDEDYLLDLTRGFHNLLGIWKGESEQKFYFDGNMAVMEENRRGAKASCKAAFSSLHYYMQDELGSPLRVSGFRTEIESSTGRNSYLTYGYDEFGNDLGKELDESGMLNPYDRQGEEQPFGYTGYRHDKVGGTYFAQMREYQSGNGRFVEEDIIKGNKVLPVTLNHYSYCWNNPTVLIDYDGKFPWWVLLIPLCLTACSSREVESDSSPEIIEPTPGNYEYKYSPEIYNSDQYVLRTNCYAYAFDIINNPVTGEYLYTRDEAKMSGYTKAFANQPGLFSGQYDIEDRKYLSGVKDGNERLINLVEADAKAIGKNFQPYEEGMEGGYAVLLVVSPAKDYHWYRQDSDGTWSHKRGDYPVETGIADPISNAQELKYFAIVGYFYITEEDTCSE